MPTTSAEAAEIETSAREAECEVGDLMTGILNGLLLCVPIWFGIARLAMWLWGGAV